MKKNFWIVLLPLLAIGIGQSVWESRVLKQMGTPVGRQEAVAEQYADAKIISEIEAEDYIFCEIETGDQHGIAAFKPMGTGKYVYDGGVLMPKEWFVSSSRTIGENQYEVYVCNEKHFSYVDIVLRDIYSDEILQTETLSFAEKNIAAMKLDQGITMYRTTMTGYDAEGNAYAIYN